jgi:N-acyl-D-aspartate/D-glutamate deacylase
MAFDLVIRNGLVVDGTGSPGFEADVAVEGERIAAIGKNLGAGAQEIDARGKVVAPGFIDPHTHMDLFLVLYPHGNPVVNFGVTTIVIGDCGASCAPVPDGEGPQKVLVAYLNRVLDNYIDASMWKWKTFPDYLNYLKGRVGVNVAALVPHSPVRLAVMGEAAYQRAANPDDLAGMERLVREAMEAGAVGFSTSPRGGPEIHAGTPSTFAEQDELVTLGNLAGEYGGCFQFNNFANLINPESSMPSLVERINARMIGNEFRLHPGEPDEGPRSLAFMEEAAKRGKDIVGVVIPYTHIARFGLDYPFLFTGLPTWEAIKGSPEELRQRLADHEIRAKLERERIEGAGNPAFPEWGGWGKIVFDEVQNSALKSVEGKNVEEVARLQECAPVDAFFDTWLQDDLKTRFIYYGWANPDEEDLAEIIVSPHGLIGTDAGAHLDRFFWYGSPARLLGYWSREKKLLSLEQAVYKLTGQPAAKLALNRGRLDAGRPADITVFDPDTISDLVSERLPTIVDRDEVNRHPKGIEAVVVNGRTVVQGGACLDAYPGKVTRQELCGPLS